MINIRPSFEETIYEFDPKATTVELEKIKSIVVEANKQDLPHRFLSTFLLPAPLIVSLKLKTVLRSQSKLNVFTSSILQKPLLIAIATVLYCVMWLYLLPVIVSFWRLFQQIYTWDDFWLDIFQWHTAQALILMFVHSFFARLAMNGFKLTKTFYDRYNLLRELEIERHSRELTMLKASNKSIANAPELVNSLIKQTINALIATGKFTPENVKLVTETLNDIGYQFTNNSSQIDYLPDVSLIEDSAIALEGGDSNHPESPPSF